MNVLGPVTVSERQINYAAMNTYPYSPALSSSASSFSSVFSSDEQSQQSSAPSSSKSSHLHWEPESSVEEARTCPAKIPVLGTKTTSYVDSKHDPQTHPTDVPVAPQLRLHPRRTHGDSTQALAASSITRPPPSLVRQSDRKDNFVESLVDTTTQMIEVIWPLSVVPCGRDTVLGGKNLIGLRTFIQEVLKRSKTSYSTLQVALYYLVLIKPCIPKVDFTKVQPEDTHASRAMQCGRRMFLAALILASKYLQDRNYSARAWSKISGLKIVEINSNEIAFVTAIDWRLHVPESLFQRWTDVVLKFSQTPPAPSSQNPLHSWRSIIPRLTPDLVDLDLEDRPSSICIYSSRSPRASLTVSAPQGMPRPPAEPRLFGESTQVLRSARSTRPPVFEPTPRASREQFPFPPISPRITQLPTPQMTPGPKVFCTPAASCKSSCRRGSAMSVAMRQAYSMSMLRCTLDSYPGHCDDDKMQPASNLALHTALMKSNRSVVSSPESMISDISTSSWNSGSSSARSTSSVGAPQLFSRQTSLATRRLATVPRLAETQHETSPGFDSDGEWSIFSNFSGAAQESYVRGDGSVDSTKTEGQQLFVTRTLNPVSKVIPSRKRDRPSSDTCLEIHNELRLLLTSSNSEPVDGVCKVLPDAMPASSFLLEENHYLSTGNTKPLDALSIHSHPSRKRIRYEYEVRPGICNRDVSTGLTRKEAPSVGADLHYHQQQPSQVMNMIQMFIITGCNTNNILKI